MVAHLRSEAQARLAQPARRQAQHGLRAAFPEAAALQVQVQAREARQRIAEFRDSHGLLVRVHTALQAERPAGMEHVLDQIRSVSDSKSAWRISNTSSVIITVIL